MRQVWVSELLVSFDSKPSFYYQTYFTIALTINNSYVLKIVFEATVLFPAVPISFHSPFAYLHSKSDLKCCVILAIQYCATERV